MSPWYRIVMLFAGLVVVLSVVVVAGCSQAPTLKEQLQAELDAFHEKYGFPGATAACILPDGSNEVVAVGAADVEREIPMTPESRMLAASMVRVASCWVALRR